MQGLKSDMPGVQLCMTHSCARSSTIHDSWFFLSSTCTFIHGSFTMTASYCNYSCNSNMATWTTTYKKQKQESIFLPKIFLLPSSNIILYNGLIYIPRKVPAVVDYTNISIEKHHMSSPDAYLFSTALALRPFG